MELDIQQKREGLIGDLSIETRLSRSEAVELVTEIPTEHLERAIKTYKEYGLLGLLGFFSVISLSKNIM